jgi:two-component system, NarL family, sensor kinase
LAVAGALCMCAWAGAAMSTPVPDGDTDGFVVLAMVPCLLVATLLVARLPGAAITRLLVVYTLCNLIPVALDAGRLWQEAHGGASVNHDAPLAEGTLLGWLAAWPWWVGTIPLIPVMMVVVPDGVPRAGLWRWVFIGQVAALVLMLPTLVDQADGATSQPLVMIGVPAGAFLLAGFMARTVSLFRMWSRADGERRLQLQPFVIAAGGLATWYLVGGVVNVLTSWPLWDDLSNGLFFGLTLAAIPTALAMAVLRHRLYGIEVLVNRAAVATLVSVILFGVYAAIAGATAELSGNGQGLDWGSVLAAGAVLALLAPVHRFASTSIDRLMFGDRDRPDRAMRHLADRLGEAVDPLDLPETIVTTVAETLRLPYVALDRAQEGGTPVRFSVGVEIPATTVALPISWAGEDLGALIVCPRTGESDLSEADRTLLADLARQSGPALFAARLALELADSRERLRLGRLEERAHIRRALHDSISPTLAGVAIAAAEAGRREPGDPQVARLLVGIERGARSGTDTLRALLDGLRPPGLADLGLVAAVEQRIEALAAASGISFRFDASADLGVIDPAAEEALYLVAAEAVTNVARHSGAHSCTVSIVRAPDVLELQVTDDGRGRSTTDLDGDGLNSARERILALGGQFRAAGEPAGGFRVHATVPQEPAP